MSVAKALHAEMMEKIAGLLHRENDTRFKAYLWAPSDLRQKVLHPNGFADQVAMMMRYEQKLWIDFGKEAA